MTDASNENYTIELKDNMLVADINGVFDEEIGQRYHQDVRSAVDKLAGQPWGSLVTYYGNSIFTPEAEEALLEQINYRAKCGMIANATVIVNSVHADIQQMQLRRIYQSNNVIFHVFSNIECAREWLADFLKQKQAAV